MQATYSHQHHPLSSLWGFVRRNTVLCIAILAAVVTSVIVPPDAQYLSYIDGKTICCLFSTLAVICALKNIHFFQILARRIVRSAGNTRSALMLLVVITFVGSMLIANDMALLTFLPLGYYILASTGKEKLMAFTFILQNIAANLGGMLTPFGNPQNLYLYSHFAIPTGEFMSIMLLPFAVSVALITVWGLRLPLTWLLCFKLDMGVLGVFLANTLALTFRTISGMIRFSFGKWMYKKV